GLRELGLPYASEPAITKHLAAFLTTAGSDCGSVPRAVASVAQNEATLATARGTDPQSQSPIPQSAMVRPDAILFNGGFFAPAITRERIAETLAKWVRKKRKPAPPHVFPT